MLGFDTKRELIKGEFAKEIRGKIYRIQTGKLNEKDKKEILSQHASQHYTFVWK